jgi:hypothetical protein
VESLVEQVAKLAAEMLIHATKLPEGVAGLSCDAGEFLGADEQERKHADDEQVDR